MNIYALSSGRGPSGIAIVRISGKDTLKICKRLTKLNKIKSNAINFCKVLQSQKSSDYRSRSFIIMVFPGKKVTPEKI